MPLIKTSGKSDRIRLALPAPGEWVEMPRTIGIDVIRQFKNELTSCTRVDPTGSATFDVGRFQDLNTFGILDRIIVRWSFDDVISPRSVRQLDDDSVTAIIERARELYPRLANALDDEEEGIDPNSGAGGTSSPPAEDLSRLNSDGSSSWTESAGLATTPP